MSQFGLKLILRVMLFFLVCPSLYSQALRPAPWKNSFSPVSTFDLDQNLLQSLLDRTRTRWDPRNHKQGILLDLPLPNGQTASYQIWRSEQMEAGLADKFPGIQTYFGQALQDPRRNVYLSVSRRGVKVFYFDQSGMQYRLEPLQVSTGVYQFVYPEMPAEATSLLNACTARMHEEDRRFEQLSPGGDRRGEVKLYRYRLALACTGEYGSYHGNTKEEVMIAMTELLLQVNAIFEREASVHFDLVTNNELLIFLDPETDPYDNNSVEDLLESNKTVCNYAIGYPNFDLGHVLATKFGGQAQIGSVCNFSRKAKAFSGLETPEGYYMGAIFAHELAHQMGAQHTQSNDCNRNLNTAFEPGSGSTLMAYAGICAPNVQSLPDDYFHSNSLELIRRKAAQGIVFGCVPGIKTDNFPPVADAGPDLYIPVGTPFQLKGSGSDPNGDSLTYQWEQMDALSPKDTLGLYGPAFRSLPPDTSAIREIGGLQDPWEQLPQHARTATFRLTVKDHHLGLGSAAYDEMTVHFIDSVGPMTVTQPNEAGVSWEMGGNQTIAWDVAGTDQEPVHCDSVSLLLSADSGQTYPYLLAAGIPNNGSYQLNLPAGLSGTHFRIKVSCDRAPFFAVSDQDFEIFDPEIHVPADTVAMDTTVVSPADTGTTAIDTVTTVVGDTIVTPDPDTTDFPVMDTVIINQQDTLEQPVTDTITHPIDTIPDTPTDTIPDMPTDTVPPPPVDTVSTPPGDTIPDMPVDTLDYPPGDSLNNPQDTIPGMPGDSLSNPPLDTVPDPPLDTLSGPGTDTLTAPPTDTSYTSPPDTTTSVDQPPGQSADDPNDAFSDIRIAPNPTSDIIFIKVHLKISGLNHFELINSQGQVLESRRSLLDAGTNELRWDLSPYASGWYWLKWNGNGQTRTKPLLISR